MKSEGNLLASIVVCLFALALLSTAAFAVPQTINYQGYLEGPGGAPVNGTVSMVFSIYNAPTGDIQLWTETQDVAVTDGAFSVVLGNLTSIALPFDEQYYLGVTVGEEAEMTPRAVLVSVPYAMRAKEADTADTTNSVKSGAVTSAGILDNTITNNDISPGASIAASKINRIGLNADLLDAMDSTAFARASHYHSGTDINTGTVADVRVASTIARDAEIMPTVLANDGAGSTLDADRLDGQDSAAFASSSHVHSGTEITSGTVADVRVASTIARDAEIMPTVLANDGAGSTLDADKLDGQEASAFLDKATYDAGADGKVDSANSADNATTAANLEGLNLAALDDRYGRDPRQMPRANTITTVDSAGQVGEYASIAIGADGLPLISYYVGTGGDLRIAKCGDAACSSGNIISTVDSAGVVGKYNSIAVGVNGWPVISYSEDGVVLKITECGDAACTAATTYSLDSGSVRSTSIAIGTDGWPIVSYFDFSSNNLKVAHCHDTVCSSADSITPIDSSQWDYGWYTSIAIGTDGLPVMAYWNKTSGYLKVAHCGNVLCSEGNTIATIDGNDAGLYASMAIGTDGLPVISYYKFDTLYQYLKVAHCGDALCSTGNTITTVDSAGDVGWYTSIAIGADGWPVISYYDATNMDLKVAKCWDASCSRTTINTLDSEGDVGQYTSIAIAPDGNPVISYADRTNYVLKVLKCANPLCLDNWTRK